MPRKGYKTITLRAEVYELAKRIIEYELTRLEVRHRNVSDLIEWATIEYIKKNYPELYERIKKELERKEQKNK